MKRIFLAMLLLVSFPVMSCEISNSGLSKEAVASLKVACEQAKLDELKQKSDITGYITADRVSAISSVSSDIAMAIGTAAKQIGIAANEFLQTPAGILVAFGIFMKLFLTQVVGIVGLIVMISSWLWFIRRVMIAEYIVSERVRLWGLYTTTKRVPVYSSFKSLDDAQGLCLLMATAFTAVIVWVLVANLI